MADDILVTPGTGGTAVPVATNEKSGRHVQIVQLDLGNDSTLSVAEGTLPMSATSLPLPTGAATEATLAAISTKLPATATTIPANDAAGQPVRVIGQDIWNCSFSEVGASVLASQFALLRAGTGVSYNQASGALNVVAGTNTNAEFLARSTVAWKGSLRAKVSTVLSQRIANNNFMWLLADLVGEGLNYNIINATTVDVTKTAHGFTSQNVGQFMFVGAITGAAGVPGRYAIASIPDANTIRFTVAGWPASGTGTLALFGHSHAKILFNGTTATAAAATTQRRGWADADTTLTINTTASPGTVIHTEMTGRECLWLDQLRASSTTPAATLRGTRIENMPDDNLDLYLYLWSFNGTSAPASSTTWTISFCSVENYANIPVYVQGQRTQGAANAAPVAVVGTVPVSIATNTPTLAAGTNRAGFIAASGQWFDDTTTALAAGATFTGTSRDLTVTATATTFANAATFAQEFRASAESDVTGTLWLEVSRDNTTWRRIKSVATAAVTGGGFYAEIIHAPSWRYARVGFTNGAGAQARLTVGSFAMAA